MHRVVTSPHTQCRSKERWSARIRRFSQWKRCGYCPKMIVHETHRVAAKLLPFLSVYGVDILCKKGLVCISWQKMLEFWIFKPRFKIYRVRWLKWYQTTLYLVKLDFWCLWKLMIFWIKNIYANNSEFLFKNWIRVSYTKIHEI